MISCVASVVWVMSQAICGVVIRSVRNENGTGGSSPGCRSRPSQSIVLPSSRAGVPVLRRPSARPSAGKPRRDSLSAGASPTRPAGILLSPMWMRPLRNVPVVSTTAPAVNRRPSSVTMPATRPSSTIRSSTAASITVEAGGLGDRRLHRLAIELAIGLGARALHGRTLRAIEQAELDAGLVGDPAHQAVERVDLADQMALAEPADRRIARHLADGRRLVGDERRARAHARGGRRRLAAGVAAADNDDIV